jgi:predicted transposase/invertase (TIGR01784 family)
MIFLDPRTDIAFKKLFGDMNHKNILISFLNSVLGRQEGSLIVDVVINDPSNIPETPAFKASIVDVRCTDQSGSQYIVEMQVSEQKYYAARAQYYSSLALVRQLKKSGHYEKLVPVIFVGILNFKLFKNDNYLNHHFIIDKETFERELKHLEFHFIELPKFTKELAELNNILDKWIYFLKYADSLDSIPESLQEPIIKEAFGVLEQGNWSIPELEAYDAYLDAARSAAGQLESAEDRGEARGEARGIEKGRLEEKMRLAEQLLDVLDVDIIAQKTGLSIADLEKLKKNKN